MALAQSTHLQNVEVLGSCVQVLAPVRLEPDQQHVGGQLAQASQRQASNAPLLKTVVFCHRVKSLLIVKIVSFQ